MARDEKQGDAEGRARPLSDTVLQLIWRERQISRAEIARRIGLARSTVSQIVEGLLQTGLVAEVGTGRARHGRPPIVLEFQSEARSVLGIEIGSAHVSVVLCDLYGKALAWKESSHPARTDPQGTLALVDDFCRTLLATRKRGAPPLLGMGVAVPSPVDPAHPDSLSEVVIPAWRGRSGLERLRRQYNVPVFVDNDANLGALAEHRWGSGRGVDDLLYIKMAHGIGAGYILGGQLYHGVGGAAGEIGHLAIDPEGKQCICGAKGCLATFVEARALQARTRDLLGDYPESRLAGKEPTLIDIEEAALAGDNLALKVVQEAAEYLGTAVAGWINLMNPGMVVLGGGLARLGELLLAPLREKVRSRTLVSSAAAVTIRTSELGSRAVAIGAATMAIEAAVSEPALFQRTLEQEIQ